MKNKFFSDAGLTTKFTGSLFTTMPKRSAKHFAAHREMAVI